MFGTIKSKLDSSTNVSQYGIPKKHAVRRRVGRRPVLGKQKYKRRRSIANAYHTSSDGFDKFLFNIVVSGSKKEKERAKKKAQPENITDLFLEK